MKRFLDRNVVNTAGVRHSWPDCLKANLDSTPPAPLVESLVPPLLTSSLNMPRTIRGPEPGGLLPVRWGDSKSFRP